MAENSDSTNPPASKPACAPVISDAVVEKACSDWFTTNWEGSLECWKKCQREDMRKILTAIVLADRAETIGKCAAVADAYADDQDKSVRASVIASAIRSLGASLPGKAGE